MHVLRCSIPLEKPTGLATRVLAGPSGHKPKQQTLLANGAGELLLLLGSDSRHGLEVGPFLEVLRSPDQNKSEPATCELPKVGLRGPAWDAYTTSLFMLYGNSVVRVDSNQYVSPVVGHFEEVGVDDGIGLAARFTNPDMIVSDGAGYLYVSDAQRIRRIKLPASWRATTRNYCPTTPPATASPVLLRLGPAKPDPDAEPTVSTLAFEAASDIIGLAYVPLCRGAGSSCGRNSSTSSAHGCGGRPDPALLGTPGGPSPATGCLVFSTPTAVYRLMLGSPGVNEGRPAAASTPTTTTPRTPSSALALVPAPAALRALLLAGREGEPVAFPTDGPGSDARFLDLTGLVADRDGAVFVVDYNSAADSSAVRRIAAAVGADDAGAVATIAEGLRNRLIRPAILPNGYLALCDHWTDTLQLLDLGLRPPGHSLTHGSLAPPPRTLATDLGALLDQQPDGTEDVLVRAGGRRFLAHRAILSARCDYFRRCLAGTGASGAAASTTAPGSLVTRAIGSTGSGTRLQLQYPVQYPAPYPQSPQQYLPHQQHQPLQQVTLPEADPDAVALVLRFLYTGRASIPTSLAPAVAELADRLLLPELCREAQARVLAEVSVETVVGAMLWAGARGPAFAGLLADLKAWYLGHQEEVAVRAPGSLKRLMAESPDLMMELHFSQKRCRGTR